MERSFDESVMKNLFEQVCFCWWKEISIVFHFNLEVHKL